MYRRACQPGHARAVSTGRLAWRDGRPVRGVRARGHPALRTFPSKKQGNRFIVATRRGTSQRSSSSQFHRTRRFAGSRSQNGQCRHGASLWNSRFSGRHAHSPAGAAVGAEFRQVRETNRSGPENNLSGASLDRTSPANYFLRTPILYGPRLRRNAVRDLPALFSRSPPSRCHAARLTKLPENILYPWSFIRGPCC